MINSDGANVRLTAEQSLQLLEWQNRLAVIQDELKKAETILEGTNATIAANTKHIDFLEEEGVRLESKVVSLTQQVSTLEAQVAESVATLELQSNSSRQVHQRLDEREQLVSSKEQEIQGRHVALKANENAHETKSKELHAHKLQVEEAREAFLKVARSLPWS